MPVYFKRSCPVCDGLTGTILHTQHFTLPEGHPLTNGYDVVSCAACGMVFADTTATQKDYDNFYARFSKYEDTATSTGGGGAAYDVERLRATAEYIAHNLPDRNVRIVDIGCGNGGLLLQLRALGYASLCGIDPSPGCVRNLKAQGLEAHQGTLHSLPSEAGVFGCAIMSHVLEHVRDVRPAIRACSGLLAPAGLLYAEVPDASRYVDCLAAPFQDFNTEHINHFSLRCLTNILNYSDFSVLDGGQKLLPTSTALPYPAAYAICRQSTQPAAIVRDDELPLKIEQYIEASQAFMQRLSSRIADIVREHPELIVWGTGQLLLKLLSETPLSKAHIVAFVDSNPVNYGKTLNGVSIIAPEKVSHYQQPILVTTLLHEKEIKNKAKDCSLINKICILSDSTR